MAKIQATKFAHGGKFESAMPAKLQLIGSIHLSHWRPTEVECLASTQMRYHSAGLHALQMLLECEEQLLCTHHKKWAIEVLLSQKAAASA